MSRLVLAQLALPGLLFSIAAAAGEQTVHPPATPAADKWPTYRNEKAGYSFSYPPDLTPYGGETPSGAGVAFHESVVNAGSSIGIGLRFDVEVRSNDQRQSSKEWAAAHPVNDFVRDRGETRLDGAPAVRVVYWNGDGDIIQVVAAVGTTIYEITYSSPDQAEFSPALREKYRDIFDVMLRSFRMRVAESGAAD